MPVKANHIARISPNRHKRRALIQSIAPKAFWSYPAIAPSRVPDGKLIEKVLVYGSDEERKELLSIFSPEKVQRVWERKLIIQEPRLHDLNRRLAVALFHIPDPEDHIQRAYRKYNLYDRFSLENA